MLEGEERRKFAKNSIIWDFTMPFHRSKLLFLIEKLNRKHSIIWNSHELKSKTPPDFLYNQNDSNQVGNTNENENEQTALTNYNNRLIFIRDRYNTNRKISSSPE